MLRVLVKFREDRVARALVQNCITLEKTQIQAALLTKGHGRQGLTIYLLVAFGLSSIPLVLFRVITVGDNSIFYFICSSIWNFDKLQKVDFYLTIKQSTCIQA